MGGIDQDLREALQDNESHAGNVPTAVSPVPAVPPQRNAGLLIALLIMGGGILTLAAFITPSIGMAYAVTPEELLNRADELYSRNLKVQGELVSGTLRHRRNPCEYRFYVAQGDARVEVHYPSCLLPDTVRDLKGQITNVTATGSLARDGHFQATDVMGKCPEREGYKASMPEPELIEPKLMD